MWLGLLLAALCALSFVHAPVRADIKALQKEIKKLQDDVDEAREDEKDAENDLAENQARQRRAKGDDLLRLKRQALDLAEKAEKARNIRVKLVKKLAEKQSELRAEAGETAATRVKARGNHKVLVAEAADALKAWSKALGELPEAPVPRSTDGLDDAEAQAVRSGDRALLEEHVKWCDEEDLRLVREIGYADAVAENKLDGGANLAKDAKELKKKLESRRDSVRSSKDAARKRQRTLE